MKPSVRLLAAVTFMAAASPVWAQQAPAVPAPAGTSSDQGGTGRTRPVVAVFGDNVGSEAVDFLTPYGVLSSSGVAEVVAVSLEAGPVHLQPALTIEADETVASFDARFPQGADFVIVPAISRRNDPAVIAWLQQQAAKGATLVSICDGAWTLAATGLLDGHRATAHWASIKGLKKAYPQVDWVRDQRWVHDGKVQSTTGVSAALPASLALVEQIGGRGAAERTARLYGADGWSAAYDSSPFRLTAGVASTAVWNMVAVWGHEKVGVRVVPGVDEAVLALTMDPLARTYRTQAVTVAATALPVPTAHGLTIIPDQSEAETSPRMTFVVPSATAPMDSALAWIGARYGKGTRRLVELELEAPSQ
ncbi:MAG TPA: DJ-1/PfpI family protein [Brevundimonas sp.]